MTPEVRRLGPEDAASVYYRVFSEMVDFGSGRREASALLGARLEQFFKRRRSKFASSIEKL